MAFSSAQVTRLVAGPYHYSPTITQWSTGITIDTLEVTTINDTAKAFIIGNDTAAVSFSGYTDTDGTAGAFLSSVNTWKSTPQPVTVAPSGLAVGSEVIVCQANESNLTVNSANAAVSGYSFTAQPDGPIDIGVSLHALGAETTSTNSAAVDGAAATANGGVAQIHVSAYSGLTNIIVLVEHSVDNSTWATLATFATVTGTTSERVTVAAGTTVRRYLRTKWTVTGTGSCTFTASFARR